MKIKTLSALLLGSMSFASSADVFISEYIEGSSNNKAVEIYNNSGTAVELGNYQLLIYANGGENAGTTINLSGSLDAYSTYVIADNDSADAILTQAQILSNSSFYNGDDYLELVVQDDAGNRVVLDTVGQYLVDPGSAYSTTVEGVFYSTQNRTLVRRSNITMGDTDGTNEFDPSVEWDVFPQDDFSNLGSHSTVDSPDGGSDGNSEGGSEGGSDSGSEGSDNNDGSVSGDVCTGCPDLFQFKDPATFDASVYYASVNALISSGSATPAQIKAALSEVISTDITRLSYSEVWTAMTVTDEDPSNRDNVILLYSGRSIPKASNGSGSVASSDGDNWNREHTWAKSHGFPDQNDEPYTDIHHLRPTDISVNAARGNLDFDESDAPLTEAQITRESDPELRAAILAATAANFVDADSFEPRAEVKGDVARMMLYMDTRYEAGGSYTDLVLVNRITSTGTPTLGKLCTLLNWHYGDPVSDFELNRNERIYQYQGNRNPFIDNPQLVDEIYSLETCSDVTDGGDTGGSDNGDGSDNGGSDNGDGSDNGSGEETDNGNSSNAPMLISAIFDATLPGGVPKGIEVFVTQDIPDLSVCGIDRGSNGNLPDGSVYSIDIGGDNSAKQGDFLYFASDIENFSAYFGFAPNGVTGELNNNGDDVVQLVCNGSVADTYGVPGVDGSGEVWEYTDGFAYRVNDSSPSATFDSAQWSISGRDALDNITANDLIPLASFTRTAGGLIISEYVEGSSFNKILEIANLTGSDVDLSEYSIRVYANGNPAITGESQLEGILAANSVFVISNPVADIAGTDVVDMVSSILSFNGDDAVALADANGNIDVIGQIGVRTVWGSGDIRTQNDTIRRKLSVTVGDSDGSDEFDPAVEWDGFPQNDTSDIGFYAGFPDGGNGDGGDGSGEQTDEELLGFCFDDATRIHAVQGEGESSPLIGQQVVVEGVVTLVTPSLNGFFMQEEDTDVDNNPLTSEGVFVFTSFEGVELQSGDVIRVLGTVDENFDRTQINATLLSASCTSDLASASEVTLPLGPEESLESVENMLITSAQEWFVTDLSNYGRFGELALSSEVKYSPTHLFAADSAEAAELNDKNQRNRIVLDDLLNGTAQELVYPVGGFDASNPVRIGDSFVSVTGVLDYGFNNYRIRPVDSLTLEQNNPRQEAPELEEGNLKVASFNVLNLFNGDGTGNGFPTARGAGTFEEYQLQLQKITNAIIAIDADVIGLMEIENDGFDELSSIAQLVDNINSTLGGDVYSFVNAGEPQGTDEISVGLLYKTSTVSLDGALKVLTSDNSILDENGAPLFDTSLNRPSFAQAFTLNESDKAFVVNVNHLKSKGFSSRCNQPNDSDTLAGNCNVTRDRAAQALNVWLAEQYQDTPIMIIGDLNAYAKEDPIQTLLNAGFKDVARELDGPLAYSYRFAGQLGSLDYALANEAAFELVVDVTEWHINADEYAGLDYSLGFPRSSADKPASFLSENVYRSSDHDPVIVSLLLEADPAIFGDVNADGVVNFRDYIEIIRAFGAREGSGRYNAAADLDNSGRISFRDVYIWWLAYLFNR
ncbi:ExeM/NucH family extracellular endonuclease [Glaciecola sp. MH2013]|uniref:ExeM/NucH family extracellular endonuclease n=1 Tax=Glaciecola sp. MH2013 TaxID=2785524 RepID=UPI00189E2792|nr:ExeM/NucH family extracellular endonuclease [Glaciecola sp. MH2013]MBF7071909.1 ExeM/NucH family extracellular endonuclease [Glaciecola sp. MH2013]